MVCGIMWWVANPFRGLWPFRKTLVVLDLTLITQISYLHPGTSKLFALQTEAFELEFSQGPLDLAWMYLDREERAWTVLPSKDHPVIRKMKYLAVWDDTCFLSVP